MDGTEILDRGDFFFRFQVDVALVDFNVVVCLEDSDDECKLPSTGKASRHKPTSAK